MHELTHTCACSRDAGFFKKLHYNRTNCFAFLRLANSGEIPLLLRCGVNISTHNDGNMAVNGAAQRCVL